MATPRAVARGIAAGQAAGTLAVPLALHVSARIAERDADEFVYDATQLANALRDLVEAVDPDGVQVSDPAVLLTGCRDAEDVVGSEQLGVAVEATRRLRASFRDEVTLVAVLPGPSVLSALAGAGGALDVADVVLALGKEFLGAGADVLLVQDEVEAPGLSPGVSLGTLANVARFHQAVALAHGAPRYGLAGTAVVGLDAPVGVRGVVVTPGALARDTDISVLCDWVAGVHE